MSEPKDTKQIDGCMGCGVCENNNPDIFSLSGEGIAEIIDKDKFDQFDIDGAGWSCPVSAINK